jgi:adenylyltransferase/sulfurtransferase
VSERSARFDRQRRLPEVGAAGQARIESADVLVVGAGGLGAPIVQYLAAAGVGALTLVDDDVVEVSNLNRQVLFTPADLGERKAERAADWVRAFDPDVKVTALDERVSVHNARELCAGRTLVVDGTDAMPSKYLLNDACVREGVPLVHGAASAFAGQAMVVPAGGRPCLRCLFPRIPGPGVVPTCQTAGVLGAVVGVVGALMAQEALMHIAGVEGTLLARYAAYDAKAPALQVMPVPQNDECPACGGGASLDARRAEDYRPS